jgi:two-component system, cell cycle response regulator
MSLTVKTTPCRILVVDDEQTLQAIVGQILTEDGHQVTTASSGEEARELFSKQPFPLVITDIVMDGISGIDLLRGIKTTHPSSEVIIMTSHAALDSAITAMRCGAYDYLIKPFDDISLISLVVARALEKMRLTGENRTLLETLRKKNVELEKHNTFLKNLSIRDGLTGLYNHRYFQEVLTTELVRSRRYDKCMSVIMVDVEHFKKYNDTYGHPVGDTLLITLARLILDTLRASDTVARYGGEEFVLILPETQKEGALHVAENLRKRVQDHPFPGRDTQPLGGITISLGVAEFPLDGTDGSSIIERADKALYKAKESGRNKVC